MDDELKIMLLLLLFVFCVCVLDDEPHVCLMPGCSFRSAHSATLKEHSRIHTGTSPMESRMERFERCVHFFDFSPVTVT